MESTRRLYSLMRPFRRRYAPVFSPKPYSTAASPQTLYPATDDQTLFYILESCKLPSSIRTVATVHGRIFKQGYEMWPLLLSKLIKVYAACDKPGLSHQLLTEICSFSSNVNSANLMMDSFVKVGEIDTANKVFNMLHTRDVVTWNIIIGGCVKNQLFVEALGMFKEMLGTKFAPNGFTFTSVVTACSKLGALNHGKWVHGLMMEKKIELNYILSSALVDLYSRCGRVDTAKSIFYSADKTDVSIWNSMINGLAMHGLAADAISVFSDMKGKNITPDPVTFIGIITVCSHCGLIEQGRKYFDMMKKDFSIEPQLEHYGAMVDLFARAGHLEEANAMINKMPMEPDVVIWRTLLSACRTHKNSEFAEFVVGKMKHLSSGDYVLLSNIYCSTKEWNNAATVRYTMNKKRIRKSIGKSWLELHGAIHHFRAGDRSHPDIVPIYRVLEALSCRSRMVGYVPEPDLVLMDISEEEKEENLNYHSEKLALAFAILKSSPGSEISISKNLRICLDCHRWIKVVSKILHRVITVRDRIRFHRFERGSCSCGDYWLEKLYVGSKVYVGLQIPDPDSASRKNIDIVLVTNQGAIVISVKNVSGFVSVDKDGNWVCNDKKNRRIERLPNPVAETKQLVFILEGYLEQRGVALPEGYLSHKVICPHPDFCQTDPFPPEIITYGQWTELKPEQKSSYSGWIKDALFRGKKKTQESFSEKLNSVLCTAPTWDRLELKGNKCILGEFLEFKGKQDDLQALRKIKRSKVSHLTFQKKASMFAFAHSEVQVLFALRDYRVERPSWSSQWQEVAVRSSTEIVFRPQNSTKLCKYKLSSISSLSLSV